MNDVNFVLFPKKIFQGVTLHSLPNLYLAYPAIRFHLFPGLRLPMYIFKIKKWGHVILFSNLLLVS